MPSIGEVGCLSSTRAVQMGFAKGTENGVRSHFQFGVNELQVRSDYGCDSGGGETNKQGGSYFIGDLIHAGGG